jgi:1-deoxy-D-xylulose-5-phosphate synthase
MAYPLLNSIDSPADIRKLKEDELPLLCAELRQFIIDAVSRNPGHLGASLGVVELAVAIHYVFNTPEDLLVWDVGHQAYPHKIITGRRDVFKTNRVYKGISGFPKRSESEYDAFGTGHASTSVSAILGMAMAAQLKGEKDRSHIAVIGDASITGGMALEALNHAGSSNANMLVILNDNNMAIDNNVGALKEYLTDITTSQMYNRMKDDVWKALGFLKRAGHYIRAFVRKTGRRVKSILLRRSNFFESFNFRYFGPVDGHDVVRLVHVLRDLKNISGPKLLHCLTIKGKGYTFAEKDQTRWHAPGLFNPETGEIIQSPCSLPKPPKYQDAFGLTLLELATQNERIVAITPAMISGSSLHFMLEKFPERVFDVGIAEQHAVTFAAGLAAQGMIPFCTIYSSFLQRAYDQVLHDVAIQHLPVVFCIDRAGLVGEDGTTHHGVYDIAYLRHIPDIILAAPMDEVELRNLMYSAQINPTRPMAIRYPRGNGIHADWQQPTKEIPIGKGRRIREGTDIAILSIGHVGNNVIKACEKLSQQGINAAHYDIRFVKPMDEEMLHEVFSRFNHIITVEDGVIQGGAGSAIMEFAADHSYHADICRLGVPDGFVAHGTISELQRECGFDANSIYNTAINIINSNVIPSIKAG